MDNTIKKQYRVKQSHENKMRYDMYDMRAIVISFRHCSPTTLTKNV